MPTITAAKIFERASLILNETTPVRWLSPEMLKWLNEGQREIVLLKPDAHSITESVQLTVGTKQSLPASGTMLLDIIRNMVGINGTTAGNAVRLVDRRILDDQISSWHSLTATATVERWVYEPSTNPRVYYVYPASTGANYLEICYAKSPVEVAIDSDVITLDDIYSPALLNYILYRAYSKDADYASNLSRAQQSRTEFLQLIGRMDLMEGANSPHLRELEKVQRTMQLSAGST